MEFSCAAEKTGEGLVLALAGDLDLAAHQRFQTEAEEWIAGAEDVVLDCSRVTFMDSVGLRVVLGLRRLVAGQGHGFVLRAPSQPVVQLFAAAGVSALFTVVGPEPAAEPE